MLLALDPASILETADEVGGIILLGFLSSNRNWIRPDRSLVGHLGYNLRLGIGILQVINDLSYDDFPSQAETVEFGQGIDTKQDGHVVPLEGGIALSGEQVEKIGRKDVKRIRHAPAPR